MHHARSNVRNEFFFGGELVKLSEKCQRPILWHIGDELRQGLRGHAYRFHFVASGFKIGLGLSQDYESVGNLLLVCFSVQPDECSNCSDFRIRRRGCDRTGLRSQWNGHKQNNGEGNSLHSGSPDEKMGREQYSGLNMQADGFYCVGPTVPLCWTAVLNIACQLEHSVEAEVSPSFANTDHATYCPLGRQFNGMCEPKLVSA